MEADRRNAMLIKKKLLGKNLSSLVSAIHKIQGFLSTVSSKSQLISVKIDI